MRVLVTRPVENAAVTIKKLEAMGLEVSHEPLLKVEQLPTPLPTGAMEGIILTSSNAVPALAREIKINRASFPVFTTGVATTRAAKEAGFTNCVMFEGSALDLAAALPTDHDISRMLYPCAEQTAHDLVATLAKRGIECVVWPCYRTVEALELSHAIRTNLEAGEITHVLLFSARTARNYARLIGINGLKSPAILTLSKEICRALPGTLQGLSRFPDVPNEDQLLNLLPNASN